MLQQYGIQIYKLYDVVFVLKLDNIFSCRFIPQRDTPQFQPKKTQIPE
jgi:hypothetical protein